MKQSNLKNSRQITVAEMAPHVHSFGINENKVNKISSWLAGWISKNLKSGTIRPYDLLPAKGDLAFHIGVSTGTMQNVFRYVEDMGLIESKQRIGTFIKDGSKSAQKLTSRRELAVETIKKYLSENGYKEGDFLISIRKLGAITSISVSTIRIAINSLISEGIIAKKDNAFVVKNVNFKPQNIQAQTLVEKIAGEIEKYIRTSFKEGDKLPANDKLAEKYKVSIKTIHDAIKILAKNGVVYSKRGKYGTIVANKGMKTELYCYEKVELKIRNYIAGNCEIGSKLPPIIDLAANFNVSAKTIKKALDNLASDGYLAFTRGRYGGTFVTDIPQEVSESYKWLALSSDYVENN